MDLQMPIMDGFEAATRIKKLPSCEEIPIVFITAVYSEDPAVRSADTKSARKHRLLHQAVRSRSAATQDGSLRVLPAASVHPEGARTAESKRPRRRTLQAGGKLSALLELAGRILISDIDGRICQSNEEIR